MRNSLEVESSSGDGANGVVWTGFRAIEQGGYEVQSIRTMVQVLYGAASCLSFVYGIFAAVHAVAWLYNMQTLSWYN